MISTNAEKKVNWNIPGDGKFDQNEPPSSVELEIGRVDLPKLTAFSNKPVARSEIDLLRPVPEQEPPIPPGPASGAAPGHHL